MNSSESDELPTPHFPLQTQGLPPSRVAQLDDAIAPPPSPQRLGQSHCGSHPAPFRAPLRSWREPRACGPALPEPMPSSGSVSRSRQRGLPMASRSLDGKVALLFGKGRGLTSTLGRHLADTGHAAGLGASGGGEKEES